MNSDKLFKIARILDENNLYALADKVDKIAQNISVNNKTIVSQSFRDMASLDQTGSDMDNFLKRTRMRNQGGGSLIPGLSNKDTRVMGPFGIDLGSKRFVDRQRAFGLGLRNLALNTPEYQKYRAKYPEKQYQQVTDPLLVSTTPQQLVQNLFDFGRQYNINNLTQAMDMYSSQGGTYYGQPINQNPQALKLYDQIKNYSGNLTPQQILSMLTGAGQ